MAQMRATTPSTYHSLLPSGTPPLLPIPLPAPSTSRRADIPEADTPPRKRLLLTTPRPSCEVGESSDAAAARLPEDPLSYCRALEARVTVLETEVRRHEWQRQAIDDLAIQHIMRTQTLEAGACVDTLEDTARGEFIYEIFCFGKAIRYTSFVLLGLSKMTPRGRPMRLNPDATPTPVIDTHTTTSVTSAQLQAMIDEGGTAVLAARAMTEWR
ncbi:hypothetical protein Tco_0977396 [Tanacetum coccineum]|uniref:Uncharacterized protein n=1 Tax=Tanacetum coccineum TaxID=301880 RepID=A0ABQ5EK13_9ASTR